MQHTDLHNAGIVLNPEYNFEAYSQSTSEEAMSETFQINSALTTLKSSLLFFSNWVSFEKQLASLAQKW